MALSDKVLCVGEPLFRLSYSSAQLFSEKEIELFLGGAELNVTMALNRWGQSVRYFTALPKNNLGEKIISYLKSEGVDTDQIHRMGERMGLYFLEKGENIKGNAVTYDRKYSSFSALGQEEVKPDEVFNGISSMYLSAISPALSERSFGLCKFLLKQAKDRGVTTYFDLNYREALWEGRDPRASITALLPYCDRLMGNIWSAHQLLGAPLDDRLIGQGERTSLTAHATNTVKWIKEQYPDVEWMASTFRMPDPKEGLSYFTSLDTGEDQYLSPEYLARNIRSAVGSGDCFMAGLIYGNSTSKTLQESLNFATTAAFGKLHEETDITKQSVEDIERSIL